MPRISLDSAKAAAAQQNVQCDFAKLQVLLPVAEESVGSASKATRQLCTASKSVLAWIIVFHSMKAIRAHSDACDGGEDLAYLQEECVGAAEWIFSLNTAS